MAFSDLVAGLNRRFESVCSKTGRFIGNRPWAVLGSVVFVCFVLILGLSGLEVEDAIFELWIERGSRVHDERDFVQKHYGRVLSRVEAIIGLPKGDHNSFANEHTLADYLAMTERLEAVAYNHTMPDGSERTIRLEDVCVRMLAPPLLLPLFDFSNMKGLPCTRTLPLDCFQEGGYDFNIKRPLSDVDPIFQNKYLLKPSIEGKTEDELADIADPGCTMWHGLPIPENFLFGGVRRGERAGDSEKILRVSSGQSTIGVLTGAQLFTHNECPAPCRKECRETVLEPCFEPCVDDGIQCIFACLNAEPEETQEACMNYNQCLIDCLDSPTCADAYSEECAQCQEACVPPPEAGLEGCVNCTAACGSAGELCYAGCFIQATPCYDECSDPCENPSNLEEKRMDRLLDGWELAAIQDLEASKDSYEHLTPTYMFVRSVIDLVDEATAASVGLIFLGYALMILYASVSLMRVGNALESKFAVGLTGVAVVALAVAAAMGVYAMAGYRFDATAIQVLPFLGLGLGTSNLFVLVSMFRFDASQSAPEMIAKTLGRAGPSVSLTSMCNFIAFAIGSAIPLPAVSNFCVAMLLVILLNYLALLFGFTAILALNARRMLDGRMDCLCWRPTSAQANRGSGGAMQKLATNCSRVVSRRPVQALVVFVALLVAAFAVLGADDLKVGLPLSDSIPQSSYVAPLLREREKNYGDFDCGLIVGFDSNSARHVPLEYHTPAVMRQILDLERNMASRVPHMHPLYRLQDGSWADLFVIHLNIPPANDPNGTTMGERVDFNHPYPMEFNGTVVPMFLPNQTNFYQYLRDWVDLDGLPFKDQIAWMDAGRTQIHSLRIVYFQTEMNEVTRILDHLDAARRVCDASPLPAFIAGLVVDTYTQFAKVEEYLASSLGYIALGISITALLFLFHPGAVLIMMAVIALTIYEIYGYMSFFGIDLNGVCIVNLLMAAGMCVEFTAHITRVFLITDAESKQERARLAFQKMLVPLTNSAISTFLGVVPLAFSHIPYFRLYFWNMLLCVLLFGVFNGLFLLPVILSYIGPEPVVGINFMGEDEGEDHDDPLFGGSSGSKKYSSLDRSDAEGHETLESIDMDAVDLHAEVPKTERSSFL